jgi:hypothetical protein
MHDAAKIVGAATAIGGTSTVTVATVTTSAPGILGAIGMTTTTTVALPVAGVLAVAGLVGYGLYKGAQYAQNK